MRLSRRRRIGVRDLKAIAVMLGLVLALGFVVARDLRSTAGSPGPGNGSDRLGALIGTAPPSLVDGADGAEPGTEDAEAGADDAPELPEIGDRVRGDTLEFTVVTVEDGVATVGAGRYEERARGEFVLVTLKVKNIGDDPAGVIGGAQAAYDARGDAFSTDTTAGILLEGNEDFLGVIDPGEHVTGVLVFDVPRGTTLTTLELRDSLFGEGERVSLA